jgi:trans-aconitate 2-methyltransferase
METTGKDFGTVEADYEFFRSHSDEAEQSLILLADTLQNFGRDRKIVRMLDFGCGAGRYSIAFLSVLHWPKSQLELTILEPVEHQRKRAAAALQSFSSHPVRTCSDLNQLSGTYDLILANHSLYFVMDLEATLNTLFECLNPGGLLLIAIAGWDNFLVKLWRAGFEQIEEDVPYYTAEDVEILLRQRDDSFRTEESHYRIAFPDSIQNRMKILRFLFFEQLDRIRPELLLEQFGQYEQAGQIEIPTYCFLYEFTPPAP